MKISKLSLEAQLDLDRDQNIYRRTILQYHNILRYVVFKRQDSINLNKVV
jgi:hypothetical protein